MPLVVRHRLYAIGRRPYARGERREARGERREARAERREPRAEKPGSIQNPDIFVLGSGGGPVGSGRSGTVRALVRKLARGDGPVGSGRDGPGRSGHSCASLLVGTVRAVRGRSGTVRAVRDGLLFIDILLYTLINYVINYVMNYNIPSYTLIYH